MSDTKYLQLFPVIDKAVKKYLSKSKYIKRIRLKGKDKHSILYSVDWAFEPHKDAPIPEYFAVTSTGRTLYLELSVPGFFSYSSPTEMSMDLEIALINPVKVEQKIKEIARAIDPIASKVLTEIKRKQGEVKTSNLRSKLVKLSNENPDGIRKHLVPLLKQALAGPDKSGRNWKEINDSKGHRWMWSGKPGPVFGVYEFEGPGIPLYRLQTILDDGGMLKWKRQVKDPKMAFAQAASVWKMFHADGTMGGNLLMGWKRMASNR